MYRLRPSTGGAGEVQARRRDAKPRRVLPDFVIIGAQKCGTTMLYKTLRRHPNVRPASTKEVHYFDLNFDKGIDWYRAHFPQPAPGEGEEFITGEASPYYLFHPHAAARLARTIPRAKLILLLKNPVDRAYSHYQHRVRKGIETLGFEEALDAEGQRLHGEVERMMEDESYHGFNHQHFSYLSRGVYVDQIPPWSGFFGRDQLLILKSEDLFDRPSDNLGHVLEFLKLPQWRPEAFNVRTQGRYEPMDPAIRRRLEEHFAPHNRRLYEYLGTDFGW